MIFRTLACLLLAATTPTIGFTQEDDPVPDPPSGRDLKELIAALYAVEPYTARSRAEIDALLAPFEAVPAPDGSKRRSVEKAIAKAWSKLRELPTKKGEHWYFDGDDGEKKRGRYFLSGRTRRPEGLFIGLHGGGLGSADASGAYSAFRSDADERDWLSIFPQALKATEHGWTDSGTEEWIMTLIDEARRTFDVPPNKIIIGGHSMGGYGTWTLGAHHADLFAAGVASAGAPTPVFDGPGEKVVDIETGVIPNLRNLPLLVYQSTDDPQVPPAANRGAVAAVEKAKERFGGFDHFQYWEVTDRGHAFPKGGVEALLSRIEDHERDPHPTRVVWQPVLDWRTSFYWLDWPNPPAGKDSRALADATVDREAGTIDVRVVSGKSEGLGVLVSSAIVDMDRELVVTLHGKEVFRGLPPTSWSTFVRTSLDQDPGRVYVGRIPLDE